MAFTRVFAQIPCRAWCIALVIIQVACLSPAVIAQDAAPLQCTVTYDPAICDSFTGRVYLMFGGAPGEPRFGPSWFQPQPFFSLDVTDWKPDTPLVFDDFTLSFPHALSQMEHKTYTVQAVMRRNLDSPTIGTGSGTAYSQALRMKIDGASTGNIDLHINTVVQHRPFIETDTIRLVELRSDVLSEFHGRDIVMRAAVVLPDRYHDEPHRQYPALYWIGGFGSNHRAARFLADQWERTGLHHHIVRIVLDPLCYGGHHVFADSDNNGPRGKALVEEFIPHLEKTFRLVPSPFARFLSGHSSGGWSSLWLQVNYPDYFGGVWSIAPDPVDFRNFQRINLYEPDANMYVDSSGNRRPLARDQDGTTVIWYDDFAKMEVVYGEGGQLRSFEWVFSERGENGLPKPLFDRTTGAVDPQVAASWKRYDIRHILETNWSTLEPKLKGKLHVFMGEQDNFFLEGATILLQQSLEKLGSDALVQIEPGKDHGTIASPALRKRIDRELLNIFIKHHPEHAPPGVTMFD